MMFRDELCLLSILLLLISCDDDEVRFGPPGGLRVTSEACPLPPSSSASDCPDWSTVVFPILEANSCSAAGCHATAADNQPVIVPGDPSTSYDNLAAYENYSRPYIQANRPDRAFVLCNLQPTFNFIDSFVMPPSGPIAAADLTVIGNWVACGMQKFGGGVGGNGGSGGAVGGGTDGVSLDNSNTTYGSARSVKPRWSRASSTSAWGSNIYTPMVLCALQ